MSAAAMSAQPPLGPVQPGQPTPEPALQGPRSRSELFWSFTALSLQGFGGVQAVAQNELVERRRWLTREEFLGEWAVAQVMPGPNIINLSLMLGDRYFGLRGALSAMAGMVVFPLMVVLLLAALFSSVGELAAVQGALRGMGAVIIGLIAVNAGKLMETLRQNPLGLAGCWAFILPTFVAMAWMRLPLVWVMMVLGGIAWFWAWRQLGKMEELRHSGSDGAP
jgi:chromate transporter